MLCFDQTVSTLSDFRAGTEAACHVEMPDITPTFRARARGYTLGGALLTQTQAPSLCYHRLTQHIARAGYDHLQIHFGLAGDTHLQSGRQTITFRQGDIGIIDTLRPAETQVLQTGTAPTHSLALFVPRNELARLLSSPDDEHCAVIRRETPIARLLTEQILLLKERAAGPPDLDLRGPVRDVMALLASGLQPCTDAAQPIREATRRVALGAVMRYIEHHLDSPELSTATLCNHFGYSRATLYRIFEPEGGLTHYICRRRLQRAFSQLISSHCTHRNILDVALEGHFASDATFTRAFHRAFGLPPGEVRSLARAAKDPTVTLSWIRRLGVEAKLAV